MITNMLVSFDWSFVREGIGLCRRPHLTQIDFIVAAAQTDGATVRG